MNGSSTFTWFKLPTALITQPKFQRLSPIAQAGFVTLCCVYWQDSGVMTYEDAEMNAEGISELTERGYVQVEDGMITIPFLDEQIEEVEQLRAKKKAAGVASAEARAKRKTSTSSTPVQHEFNTCSTDKNRVNQIDEKKETDRLEGVQGGADAPAPDLSFEEFDSEGQPTNQPTEDQKEKVAPKRKRFEPPTETEAQAFFQTTARPDLCESFYNYYLANGWRVGRNPMKDWKAAARQWIARDKQFTKPQPNGKQQPVTEQLMRDIANDIANGGWNFADGA